jgi:hypothetical protein
MKRNLIPYVKDILDNLELAEGFTAGMSYDEFSLVPCNNYSFG